MCLYPKLINNKKYVANKKNGGVIPAITDKRTLLVPVGCGKCMECRKQKKRNWQVRLQEEIKTDNTGKFITLTFSNESIAELDKCIENNIDGYERDNKLAKIAVRRFLERWRKKHKKSVKHWLVTEIGGKNTERIHLHGILFTNKSNEEISDKWKYGIITIGKQKYYNGKKIGENNKGYVNEKTINYIVKYITKTDIKHPNYTSIVLTSSGIGKNYINNSNVKNNKFNEKETDETYRTKQGHKIALPIYYRNKIYTEEEREKLWLNKLDEQIRYVNGEKIDISKGDEEYYKVLDYWRRENKRLGFGDNVKDWEKIWYERQQRNLKKKEILKEVEKKEIINIPKGKIEDTW